MEEWRLLGPDTHDAYMNMAVDEAVLHQRSKNLVPNTIRFYTWKPSAVSIGYFQSLADEVDAEACKKLGIDVVRRITGGGAVYHDSAGEVTYSVIVAQDHPKIPADVLESYKVLCGGILLGLGSLGIDARFQGINDVIVNERKISGNAQTRRLGMVLQHGTILLETDVYRMFQVLRVSDEKIKDKLIESVEQRVTSIRRELKRVVSQIEVMNHLKAGFEKSFGIRLKNSSFTGEERDLALKLRVEKYMSHEWVARRQ